VQIGNSADTTIKFSTTGSENPAGGAVGDITIPNIAVSATSPAHGIYFSSEGGFSGKTLTLNNADFNYDGIDYLIAASATAADTDNRYCATAIDLSGVSGTGGDEDSPDSPFTLVLDNASAGAPKDYRFSAQITEASNNSYAVAIGVPWHNGTGGTSYFIFDPQGARLVATAATSTGSAYASAALFGAGYAGGGNFTHWTVGNFGDTASLTSTATSTGSSAYAYAALFGAGYAGSNTFSNWTVGDFGDTASLTSTATSTGSAYAYAYVALFGAGYGSGGNFTHWTVGDFGDTARLTSTATGTGSSSAYAALFGAGYAGGGNFSNWTVGNFGDTASLTSTATSTGSSAYAYAALFGAGSASSNNFSNWTVGNFGDEARLTSTASASAALFGAGSASSNNFSNWTVGNFGDTARLTSTATSTGSSASAALFGAGYANGGTFTHWTVGNFGDTARLTSTATSTGSSAYAALFGAGYAGSTSTATVVKDWTAEFKGNATLSTVGYSSTPNNIHLGTLGGDKNEDFRFYFNSSADATDTTVSIGALKLDAAVATADGEGATMTLSASQGSNSTTYARAVALGSNFQLNVGRARMLGPKQQDATLETTVSIASGGRPSGGSGTLNIFGAIAKARANPSGAPRNSIIRIDSGWTVNAYGPVEDLSSIAVNDGTFNTYGSIRDITLSSGETRAYGTSDGIGTIILDGGNLSIARCDDTKFDDNFEKLRAGMHYVGSDGTKYGAGTENNLVIKYTDAYPWKGTTDGGKLTLNTGDALIFHVDTSQPDSAVKSMAIAGADGVFEHVRSHVIVEDGGTLEFNGGKICLINHHQDISSNTVLPAHTDVWIIRTKNSDGIVFNQSAYDNNNLEDASHPDLTTVTRHAMPASQIMGASVDGCAELQGDLNVYMFHNSSLAGDNILSGGIYVGNYGDVPVIAVPTAAASRQANSELAGIITAATSILRSAAINSLTDASRSNDGLFAGFLGGHLRQDDIDGFGYHVNLTGIACGVDHLCQSADTCHSVRLGALAGYLGGDTRFSGTASGNEKIVTQKIFSGAVFAAYETLGKSDLKTNVNVFAGLQHARNEMSRVNGNGYSFSGKMNANGQFVTLEAVKILHHFDGVQVGPWALVSYNRVYQKGYDEHGNAPDNAGAQTVSSVTHNFLDTTIGLNVEKEWQRADVQRDGTRAFLKCGWQCRMLQKHTDASVKFNSESLGNVPFPALFGYPGRNSFALIAGLHANLNGHWDTDAAFHTTLAKNDKSFALSFALGYNF
jgi:hypothetical protein